jgi:hypothetical protein
MGNFDVKFRNYESAMQANNNFGLSGQSLAEQYGRYSLGLQIAEQKAENKAFGKAYGKEIAIGRKLELHPALRNMGIKASDFTTNFGTIEQLRNIAPLGRIDYTAMPQTLDFNTTIGKSYKGNVTALNPNTGKYESVTPEQAKIWRGQSAEIPVNSGANKKVTFTRIKQGANKGKWGVYVDDKLESVHDSKTQANKAFNQKRIELGQITPKTSVNKPVETSANKPAETSVKSEGKAVAKKAKGNVTAFNPNTGKYESVTPEQAKRLNAQMQQTRPAKGNVTALNPNTGKYESVTPEQAKIWRGQSAETPVNKPVETSANKPAETSVKSEGEAVAKKAKGKGLRLGTRLKAFARRNPKLAKAGKWGAIAAAVIGVGALLLSKCSSDKAEEVKAEDVKPAPIDETPKENQPKEETPVVPVDEKPAYEPIVKLNDDGTYTTKKNDNFYKLAENLLKDYCAQNGIDKEIKSTSPEVQILAERIMKKNEYWYDSKCTEATKRLSAPMLYPNEILEMADIADLVKKEEEVKKAA